MVVAINPGVFMKLVPKGQSKERSGRKMRKWKISVQRFTPDARRWKEIASWTVLTLEDGMTGLLNAGMRDGWRVVVLETPTTSQQSPVVTSSKGK